MDFMNKAQFVCLSTDTKPTAVEGYSSDLKYSLLLELDTGDFYYYDGTAWTKLGEAPKQVYYIANNKTLIGQKDGNNYNFEIPLADVDEAVLNKMSEIEQSGTVPPLTISCKLGEEQVIDDITLNFAGEESIEWYSDGVLTDIYVSLSESDGFLIQIDYSAFPGQGEEITVSLTLSFEV